MLRRISLCVALALLMALPTSAQEYKDGRYTAVTIDDDGVEWKIQLNVKGKNISGEFSYDNCTSCDIDFSANDYYCKGSTVPSSTNFTVNCINARRTAQDAQWYTFVQIIGNLNQAHFELDSDERKDFTFLNERDFSAYQRFAATNKNVGTDKYASQR